MTCHAHPFFPTLISTVIDHQALAGRIFTQNPRLLDLRDGCGQTALHILAQRGETDAVCWILGQGANPNVANDLGSTPLIDAAKCGHLAVCEALLAAGADPDMRERSGDTALAGAALCGQTEVVALLLDRCPGDVNDRIDSFNAGAICAAPSPITERLCRAGLRVALDVAA
jgi:ankyrin repeat protein